jgi:hypothetical protein
MHSRIIAVAALGLALVACGPSAPPAGFIDAPR